MKLILISLLMHVTIFALDFEWVVQNNPILSPDPSCVIRDVVLINQKLYFTADRKGVPTLLAEVNLADPKSPTVIYQDTQISSLKTSFDGKQLIFFESKDQNHPRQIKFLALDSSPSKTLPIWENAVYELEVFKNGNILVRSDNLNNSNIHLPLTYNPSILDDWGKVLNETQENQKYSLFLMSPQFHLLKRLLPAYGGKDLESRSEEEFTKGNYKIRLAKDGVRAVVFSPHLPGIQLFNDQGLTLGTWNSPGQGMTSPKGYQIWFQSDVILTSNLLFVTDVVNHKLWKISLDNDREPVSYELPLAPLFLFEDAGWLYIWSRNGTMIRTNMDSL